MSPLYKSNENKLFFSGINSLRFFAALAVIITHIELLKTSFGYKSYWKHPVIYNLGGMGVYFFFVLSGFLITYLLLTEKNKFKDIKIKEFYIRRILRIWPLYYLIVIIGFFVLPNFPSINIPYLEDDFSKHFSSNLFLYIIILPNLAFSLYSAVPHIGQAWSIGVEEQFYIIWPWLILKSKNILRTLIWLVVGILFIKITVLILGNYFYDDRWYKVLKLFLGMSKFECMAIGGIGAYVLFIKSNLLLYVYNKFIFIASILLIPILIYIMPDKLQDGSHLAYSILFLIIILNASRNDTKYLIDNKVLNYLGKISYGIYMYHFMIIPIVLVLIKKYFSTSSELTTTCLVYLLSVSLTVVVSGLSYKYLESYFIRLKSKYALIQSGD